jgi:hypothetical protein
MSNNLLPNNPTRKPLISPTMASKISGGHIPQISPVSKLSPSAISPSNIASSSILPKNSPRSHIPANK